MLLLKSYYFLRKFSFLFVLFRISGLYSVLMFLNLLFLNTQTYIFNNHILQKKIYYSSRGVDFTNMFTRNFYTRRSQNSVFLHFWDLHAKNVDEIDIWTRDLILMY
jgi:hypothetical protein